MRMLLHWVLSALAIWLVSRVVPGFVVSGPMAALIAGLEAPWQPGAVAIYRNWLKYVALATDRTRKPAVAGV